MGDDLIRILNTPGEVSPDAPGGGKGPVVLGLRLGEMPGIRYKYDGNGCYSPFVQDDTSQFDDYPDKFP
jgi:hypothetical protein